MKHKTIFNEKLSSIKLPQLPQVLVQLIDLCRSEEPDIRLVAQTVAQDISITTKTLQLANSAFLGARSQFKNIDQAVIFLGIDTVRNLAISVSVHEVFGKSTQFNSIHFDSEQFWYHSLLTALISKTLAQKSGYDDPGAAYLTGLLHDTGQFLLCQHLGENYQTLIKSEDYISDPVAAEKKAFGISHCDVGQWLLDSWNMPEDFGIAVRDHHSKVGQNSELTILSRILRLANTLTEKCEVYDEQTLQDASLLRIAPSSLATILEEQTETLEGLAQTLGIQIKEPESYSHIREKEKNQQRLNDKVELRAQLYGFMDNIIQARTIQRVFLVLEESLSLLFNCDESILLLPGSFDDDLTVHGSFRNKAAKKLKEHKFTLAADTVYSDATTGNEPLASIKTSVFLSRRVKCAPLDPLFEVTQRDFLLAVPVRISPQQQGLLLLGLAAENDAIRNQEETLQLISSHVGNRLYQEIQKEEYAAAFAKERITTVEEMARSIAHEISNPLGVIQNYITLLSETNEQSQTMSKDLSIINKEIERIANISNQLNDLSTPLESTHSTFTDINKVLVDTVNLFQKSIPPQANISIDFIPLADVPSIWMEENSLKQILGNLLSNSIDALGDQGAIEVHCHHVPETSSTTPGEIIITVSDNGPGVPSSIVDTMFRAGKTTKTAGHAGLGLAIVKKLIKDLSGRIYHSTGKQGNTQFTIHLPIFKQPHA